MEYWDVGSVHDVLQMLDRELTEEEIAAIVWQVTRGLQHLHAAHVVHRDIKAANIVLNSNGEAKIVHSCISQLSATNAKRQIALGYVGLAS